MIAPRCNIFVLTTARDTTDPWVYLKATIDQIEQQNPNCYKAIICDGPYDGPRFNGWDVLTETKKNPGNRDAWFALMAAAVATGGDALCFEDDITICPAGLDRMLKFYVPQDLVAVKFFTPKVVQVSPKDGLHRIPSTVKASAGALFLQALKFRHQGMAEMVEFRHHPNYAKHEAGDLAIGQACVDLNLKMGQHKPDLVQHVGEVSKAGKTKTMPWWHKAGSAWQTEEQIRALNPEFYV